MTDYSDQGDDANDLQQIVHRKNTDAIGHLAMSLLSPVNTLVEEK